MPDSLEAALTFALVIAPGYQLVRGYAVARGADAPSKDLYVLAQAVVASLAWLALIWVVVDDLLAWISDGSISGHLLEAYAIAPLLVGLPYLLGRIVGLGTAAVMRPVNPRGYEWMGQLLRALGLAGQDTAWDRVWRGVLEAGRGLVTAELDEGRSIVGQFASESFVATSPAEPAVYFERAYEVRDDGDVVTYPQGMYVDGGRIVALKFNEIG